MEPDNLRYVVEQIINMNETLVASYAIRAEFGFVKAGLLAAGAVATLIATIVIRRMFRLAIDMSKDDRDGWRLVTGAVGWILAGIFLFCAVGSAFDAFRNVASPEVYAIHQILSRI